MNYHRYFGSAQRKAETCIVGTGDFGRTFLGQARRTPLLSARVGVDMTPGIAAEAFKSVGIDPREIELCETAAQARAAWDRGRFIAAGNVAAVLELPVDVVIEATGHPEAAARHAHMAIEAGKHVAMASKEADSVIGPGLSAMARERGRVVTPVDGDQPSLLIGLVTWAETCGLTIVAAGKSSEYDFVYDERAGTMLSNKRTAPVPGFSEVWDLGSRPVAEIVQRRAELARALPQKTVPDLCELLVAANSTTLGPDKPDMHVPIARISEVPTMLATKADGGLLDGTGRIDVFNCLRRPDELSFAGGVFVVVKCEDESAWKILAEKGHVVSRNGATAMLYSPRHILGLEAATSVLSAAILGLSTGADEPRPRYDLCAHADADLKAGTVLTASGHHHSIVNVSGYAVPGAALAPGVPVPFYLAANRKLVRNVAKGDLIKFDDVEMDEASPLLKLRRHQDKLFFGGGR